jgi:hypothetical protein
MGMLERFRKGGQGDDEGRYGGAQSGAQSLAVQEREQTRGDDARFARDGDRDRDGVDDRTEARTAPPADRPHDHDHDRDRDGVDDRAYDRDGDGVVERDEGPIVGKETLAAMHARQRDRHGGIQWGSAFFGLLSALGLAAILTSLATAAGFALGFSTSDVEGASAETIGLGGGIALLVILALAWYCGGYVAGRMARFDGFRQGLGVFAWTILAIVVVALIGLIGGSEYNVFENLNLPNIPVGDSTLTAGGAIAGAAALLVMVLFAILGGKAGERFHRRVDRLAAREYRAASRA